jgi:hypothetical protein
MPTLSRSNGVANVGVPVNVEPDASVEDDGVVRMADEVQSAFRIVSYPALRRLDVFALSCCTARGGSRLLLKASRTRAFRGMRRDGSPIGRGSRFRVRT